MSTPTSADEIGMSAVIFNIEAFSELIELEDQGSAGLIVDLIGDYMVNSAALSLAIVESARSVDLKLLERSAHSLKSSSKLLGLEALAEVAYRIEDGARQGAVRVDDVALIRLYLDPALVELMRFRDSRPAA
jgi:HPt (histidine-containing phosphotransfer) domain-containing protein